MEGRHRLDKWLWCARFYKSRALATDAVAGGKVKWNGERVKPAHEVRPGDRISVMRGEQPVEVEVIALLARRGPATEAQAAWAETAASRERSERFREQHRLATLSRPRPESRPDKRERRHLDRLRRNQG